MFVFERELGALATRPQKQGPAADSDLVVGSPAAVQAPQHGAVERTDGMLEHSQDPQARGLLIVDPTRRHRTLEPARVGEPPDRQRLARQSKLREAMRNRS